MSADIADVSSSLGRSPLFVGAGGGQPIVTAPLQLLTDRYGSTNGQFA
jgi:hypothetical protein